MKMALCFPIEIQKRGRCSSVCLHPTKNLAVSIHEAAVGEKLYYSVFTVKKSAGDSVIAEPIEFNYGKHPSVAMVYSEKDDKTLVITTLRSKLKKDMFYQIGVLDEAKKMIDWQGTNPFNEGVKPKVCATNDGLVVIVSEEKLSVQQLRYRTGNVTYAPPRLNLKSSSKRVPDLDGVEPDIAMSDTTIIIICRKGLYTLQTKLGTIRADGDIDWAPAVPLTSAGINPTISINSKGYVVELHQTKTLRKLHQNHGQILPTRTVAWMQPSLHATGEYPTVSMNDDNFVFAIHKKSFGTKLYHSQCELTAL